jgi:hypothetical protein
MKHKWGEEILNARREDEEIAYSERICKEALELNLIMAVLVMIINMVVRIMIDDESMFSGFGC